MDITFVVIETPQFRIARSLQTLAKNFKEATKYYSSYIGVEVTDVTNTTGMSTCA